MRTKKTIRKMSPLARRAAQLSRSIYYLQKRLDLLVVDIDICEGYLEAETARAQLSLYSAK
jgi:lysyl-tRNA synthetase class II